MVAKQDPKQMSLAEYISRRDRRRRDFDRPRHTVVNKSHPCESCGCTDQGTTAFWLAGERWCEDCWKRQRNDRLGLIPHGNTGTRDLTYRDDDMSPWQENAYKVLEQ